MEKHYCDYCGEEIKGTAYCMTIRARLSDWLNTDLLSLWQNHDLWERSYDLCETCAKTTIPKMMKGHLCECEEKCHDDACKSSEEHEKLYTYTTEDGREIKCNNYWALARIEALETGKCKIVPVEAE